MADAVTFNQTDSENSMEVARNGGGFYIEIDRPLAGDSECSFGMSLDFQLTDAQMAELILWAKDRIVKATA